VNVEMKKNLVEVTFVRLVLIFLLVFYHSFAMYSGAWVREITPPNILLYDWMDRLSFSFMLESFVFISGYVYGYQSANNSSTHLFLVVKKKFKRLVIPSLVFGIAYIFCFNLYSQFNISIIYDLFNGVGHLWFLPMLFWCFVIMSIIEPYIKKSNVKTCLFLSFFFALLSVFPMVFRFDNALYYFPFFMGGFLSWQFNISVSRKKVILLTFYFLAAFVILSLFNLYIIEMAKNSNLIMKTLLLMISVAGKFAYATLGVYLVFCLMIFIRNSKFTLSIFWIRISELCFGVYLLQQFILIFLIDNTNIYRLFNDYLFPWAIFFITLIVSLLVSLLIRKSKIGRELI